MALEGTRVIELEGIGPGPLAGCMMADFGAEVISVSRVVDGKIMAQGDPVSRGKKSIALDLKTKAGMDAMKELVKTADVFIEPFRPGVTEKLGLGPDDLCTLNPRLIYGRMTGWGQGGDPKIEKSAGHDANYLALAGLLDFFNRSSPLDGEHVPQPPANFAGDFAGGGMMLAIGIFLALLEREKSGQGQVIDAAMTDGAAYVGYPIFKGRGGSTWPLNKYGDAIPAESVMHNTAHWHQVYETKPEPKRPGRKEWFTVCTAENHFYKNMLTLIGLGKDYDSFPKRPDTSQWPMMRQKMAAVFLTKTRDEWAEVFRGNDGCGAPVLNAEEAWNNPHNKARGTFAPSASHPGKFEPAPAPKLSRTPGHMPRPDPVPGGDTRAVLMGLGMSEAQANELFKQGVAVAPTGSKL